MSANIEIKARVRNLSDLHLRAAALSDQPLTQLDQEDTFFSVPRGRLKLRILRPDYGELIVYERPDDSQPKRSEYFIAGTTEPARLREVLARALGIRGVVRKRRTLYHVGVTRIHLDEVEGLGHFVELEVVLDGSHDDSDGRAIAADLMSKLGIESADLVSTAYIDLLEKTDALTDGRP